MNVMTKVNEVRDCVIKKAVPLSISAVAAANALLMTVSAEEAGGSSVDFSAVTDTLTSSLTDLVGKAMLVCAGVVGAGLSIFGLKWVIKTVKGFFNKIAG